MNKTFVWHVTDPSGDTSYWHSATDVAIRIRNSLNRFESDIIKPLTLALKIRDIEPKRLYVFFGFTVSKHYIFKED